MGERLTVLCWLWSQPDGRAKYGAEHVNIWAAMVSRHLTLNHELACVTDMPAGIDPRVRIIPPPGEFLNVALPTWGPKMPQCLRRLSMFRRDAASLFSADRVVCMDLDLIVCGSLDPVLDIQDDFKIAHGTHRSRLYNGSLMSLRMGSRPQAYERFSPEKAVEAGKAHVGSDQAWLAACLPNEKTWTAADGVSFWGSQPTADARVIFFAGRSKPWAIAEVGRDALVARHYRGARRDRCLVLGFGPNLWDDVAAAVDGDRFGAVIASPEAAAHWPGPVLAVADDDAHAERLAAMHGFEQLTWCGRSGGLDGASR